MGRRYKSSRQPAMGIQSSLALALLGAHAVSAGFIDMDTPLNKRTTTSLIDGTEYHLVSKLSSHCLIQATMRRINTHNTERLLESFSGHVG